MTAREKAKRQAPRASVPAAARRPPRTALPKLDPEIEALLAKIGHHASLDLNIVPMGEVGDAMPAFHPLEERFPIKYHQPLPLPRGSLDFKRRQYRATDFIANLNDTIGGRSLGVTHVDLFEQKKNFVFGLAETQGSGAIISTHRLRHSARTIFWLRVRKEAVHEIGHLLGLSHCHSSKCVMYFSTTLEDTDAKGEWFCVRCSSVLATMHDLDGRAASRQAAERI
ncbi:MAG TPA: archaemetzincin family Zn-dependent metalloprotease [Thermoplasmata archaeon]|nr:archaemetzincin family Zn-dependent metalloprotease [Thermoplasmata archaeon]